MNFSEYLAPVGQICVMFGQCATYYIDWFYMISHPIMRPARPEDPTRHPSVMHDDTCVEPDIPQYPVAATTMEEAPADAPSHVKKPRHAMVTYIFN